jgi:hypothetical protein
MILFLVVDFHHVLGTYFANFVLRRTWEFLNFFFMLIVFFSAKKLPLLQNQKLKRKEKKKEKD